MSVAYTYLLTYLRRLLMVLCYFLVVSLILVPDFSFNCQV